MATILGELNRRDILNEIKNLNDEDCVWLHDEMHREEIRRASVERNNGLALVKPKDVDGGLIECPYCKDQFINKNTYNNHVEKHFREAGVKL